MVAGLATISGNMLVVYATMIAPVVPDAAGQLLTASLIAAPAAILAALLMLPESEPAAVARGMADAAAVRQHHGRAGARHRGWAELLLGIMASLIVFVALVALLNMMLEPLTGLTLQRWPASSSGRSPGPWASRPRNARPSPQSLGIKVVVNEFVSYLQLAASGGAGLAERSRVILTYALCGFTNFASVGIMVTGMSALCPERRGGDHRAGAEEPGRGQHRLLHGRGDGRGAHRAVAGRPLLQLLQAFDQAEAEITAVRRDLVDAEYSNVSLALETDRLVGAKYGIFGQDDASFSTDRGDEFWPRRDPITHVRVVIPSPGEPVLMHAGQGFALHLGEP